MLLDSHAREKPLLLSHDPVRYKEKGQLVAEAAGRVPSEFATAYESVFSEQALRRILGFFQGHPRP